MQVKYGLIWSMKLFLDKEFKVSQLINQEEQDNLEQSLDAPILQDLTFVENLSEIQPLSIPDDSYYYMQWYLPAVNIESVWDDYTGEGINIGIFDGGLVEYTHNDLNDNINQDWLIEYNPDESDIAWHATFVAGIIAGEQNGQGIVGAAYDSSISSYTWNEVEHFSEYDVVNNSWGVKYNFFYDNFLTYIWDWDAANLENAVSLGRNGLGTSVVFSAGNDRVIGGDTSLSDNVNYHNFQSSRYTIAVAATNEDSEYAYFSTPGAALLVTAPGTSIYSTDVGNSYYYSQGTSFSAPIVTGIIALMLEANPNLGYRDVQEILAYSSVSIDDNDSGWVYNGADNWNGGGLHTSHDYGFGIVDALAAVRLAETWAEINVFTNEDSLSIFSNVGQIISDNEIITQQIYVDEDIDIEHVEVKLDIDHTRIGDLTVKLISPDGTESILVDRPKEVPDYLDNNAQNPDYIYFVLDSTNSWGELSSGNWTLEVKDNLSGETGIFNDWELRIYGKEETGNDTYIYTNEFAEIESGARQTLSDTEGVDIINTSAVSGNVSVNLIPEYTSNIAGNDLYVESGTFIEHAFTGDGNDILIGNMFGNYLNSGRGNDSLLGNEGEDILFGAQGDDTFTGGADKDTYIIDSGSEGSDIIFDFDEDLGESIYLVGFDNINSFYDLNFSENNGGVYIDLDGNQSLFLEDSAIDELLESYFYFYDDFKFYEEYFVTNEGQNSFYYGFDTDDYISAGQGNDKIFGSAGNDTIYGNEGNDTIYGELGIDSLFGGEGNDLFVIEPGFRGEIDRIEDFEYSNINEKIDLTAFTEITSFEDLIINDNTVDAVISFINAQLLVIEGCLSADLSADNFIFALAENNPPEIGNPMPDQNVTIGETFNFAIPLDAFIDPDGDILSYTVEMIDGMPLPDWLNFDPAMRTFTGTPAGVSVDMITVKLIASDGEYSAEDTFDININASFNVINPENETYTEDINLNFGDLIITSPAEIIEVTLILSDLQAGVLSVNTSGEVTSTFENGVWSAIGAVADINILLAELEFIPTENYNGDFTIELMVEDGGSNIYVDTINMTGTPVNDLPVAGLIEAQTDEDTPVVIDVLAEASDVDGDAIYLVSVSYGSDGIAEIVDNKIVYTPNENFNGQDTITYGIMDGSGENFSQTIDITVNPINDAPVLENPIIDQEIIIGEEFSFTILENTFTDVDGDVLTYSAVLADGNPLPDWLSFDAAMRTFTGTPAGVSVDMITVKLIASDGEYSAEDTFDININASFNVINPNYETYTEDINLNFGDMIITSPEDTAEVTLILSDLQAGILSVNTSGDVTSTFENRVWRASGAVSDINILLAELEFIPTENYNNNFTIGLIVEDGVNNIYADTINMKGTPVNDLPVAGLTEAETNEDTPVVIDVLAEASDVEGDAIFLLFVSYGSEGIAEIIDQKIKYTPKENFNGNVTIEYGILDGSGENVYQTIDITVNPINDAPVLENPIVDQEIIIGEEFSFTILENTFSDVEGDVLTYSAVLADGNPLPDWLSFDADTQIFSGIPEVSDIGSLLVKVIANDGEDSIDTEFNITIEMENAIEGTPGDDTITGTIEDDFILGLQGNDEIYAGEGNDYVEGGEGDDFIFGSAGDDSLYGGEGNDSLSGHEGNDYIEGGEGNDVIYGFSGNNILEGGLGNDTLIGGSGDDIFVVKKGASGELDTIKSFDTANFNERIDLTSFTEIIDFSDLNLSQIDNDVVINFENGQLLKLIDCSLNDLSDSNFIFVGSIGNSAPVLENSIIDQNININEVFNFVIPENTFIDTDNDELTYTAVLVDGNSLPDWLSFDENTGTFSGTPELENLGYLEIKVTAMDKLSMVSDVFSLTINSDNSIIGTNEYDYLTGTSADEILMGFGGGDYLNGGEGNDTLYGGDGNDELWVYYGNNYIDAGNGDDYIDTGEGNNTIYGRDGNDDIIFYSGSNYIDAGNGDDSLSGGFDNDTIYTGEGNDSLCSWGGDDYVESGAGNDYLIFQGTGSVFVDGGEGNDTIFTYMGTDTIYGGSGDDSIYSGSGDDYINGGDGNDDLGGNEGNQTIYGGSGDDFIRGQSGNDLIYGGAGSDRLEGGSFADVFVFEQGNLEDIDIISDFNCNEDKIDVSAFTEISSFLDLNMVNEGSLVVITLPGGQSIKLQDCSINELSVDNFIFLLGEVNNAPILENPIVDQEINIGEEFSFTIQENTFTDADGDDLSYSAIMADGNSLPEWLHFDADTCTFSGVTGNLSVDMVSVKIMATDGQYTAEDSFDIVINQSLSVDNPNNNIDYTEDINLDFGDIVIVSSLATVEATLILSDLQAGVLSVNTSGDVTSTFETGVWSASGTIADVNTLLAEVEFIPTGNYNSNFSIELTVDDGVNDIYTDTINMTGISVNDLPVANLTEAETNEDTEVIIDVLADSSDVDEDTIILTEVTNGTKGTAEIVDNKIVYTPAENVNGTDEITYTISDGTAEVTQTVDIIINSVNDLPVANLTEAETNEDTLVVIDVLADSSDVDGDTIILTEVTNGTKGTAEIVDNKIVYTPAENVNGTDEITYTISDGTAEVTQTVDIIINSVNDLPVANLIEAETNEDTEVIIDVLAETSDVDGDTIILTEVTNGTKGTAEIVDNKIVYTPAENVNGTDEITYTISDGTAEVTQTVDIIINSVNDLPVANLTEAETNEDIQVVIDVLADASDVDGDTIILTEVTQGTKGTAEIVDNKIVYTPAENVNGTDEITYTISDGTAEVTQTVDIIINSVNDLPVVNLTEAETNEDTPVVMDVLADSSDVDGDTIILTEVTNGTKGTAEIVDNKIVYIPAENVNGTDEITYTISDGTAEVTQTVDIIINSVNDLPVANLTEAETNEEIQVVIDVLADASDVDGDTITLTEVTNGTKGTAEIVDNKIVYTPAENVNGTDEITYTISDGTAEVTQTVDITINAVNDLPVANLTEAETNEDTEVIIDVLAETIDVDGDTIILTEVTNGTKGTAEIVDNKIVYTPAENVNGTDEITYTISDGTAEVTQTIDIIINSVNDAPILENLIIDQEIIIGEEFTLDITDNFLDVDLETLTYTVELMNGSVLPGWLVFDENTGIFSGSPEIKDYLDIEINVIASDGEYSVSDSFKIDIVSIITGTEEDDNLIGYKGQDTIYGEDGDDNLDGYLGDDVLYGGKGNDVVDGGLDDDYIEGGAGNDTVIGSGGADTLTGGKGVDLLEGGNEDDLLIYNKDSRWSDGNFVKNNGSPDNVIDGEVVSLTPRTRSFDMFDGGTGEDILQLTDNADALILDDRISFHPLGEGARVEAVEKIYAGEGDDLVDFTSNIYFYKAISVYGENGNDILWTNYGNDFLSGGIGNDSLFGGSGNDTLIGGAGADTLVGSLGEDVFDFSSLDDSTQTEMDSIQDFYQTEDLIDVSGLGFTNIEQGTADGSVLGFDIIDGNTYITADESDFGIELIGEYNLVNTDFIFE
jgi:Ca2+-binding RTX toxin-like protein